MNKIKVLQDVLILLKAAKENPEGFAELEKALIDSKLSEKGKAARREKTKAIIGGNFSPESKQKGVHLPSEGVGGHSKRQKWGDKVKEQHQGSSDAGQLVRYHGAPAPKKTLFGLGSEKRQPQHQHAINAHKEKLSELKQMPKPNLPKSEEDMGKQSNPLFASEKTKKEESKHDRCVDEVSKDPKIKNPHAVCVAAGVKPEKWEKGEKDMNKSEKSALELAKELLKAAQENPAQFEELSKALAPAPAPMLKPAMPKPKMAAPKPPKMQAPPMMKEEEGESEEDESSEHEEKESKEHEEKEMEKAAKKMEKCGPVKMSKEEIKADLKKEWKPKFKKG